MKKIILPVVLLALLSGCEQEDSPNECVEPYGVSATPKCFQPGNVLHITALTPRKKNPSDQFLFWLYPQSVSGDISMSDENLIWGNASDNNIYIPSKELDGVTRFALRVETNCNGLIVSSLNALFELNAVSESCNEWEITILQ